jgi:allantoin racemase
VTIAGPQRFSVLLINPNTSRWVTDKLASHLGTLMGPGVRLDTLTARFGSAYIASEESFEVGARAVMDAWSTYRSGPVPRDLPDAVLIGCFGDPGLQELRLAAAPVPVLGLAQVAIAEAHRAGRFAIVTGGAAWKPMLARQVEDLGWQDQLDNIAVIEQSGADLAHDPQAALRLLAAACRLAAVPGVRTVVLGGAGFAGYGDAIAGEVPVPVIDSVSAAARALLALGDGKRSK